MNHNTECISESRSASHLRNSNYVFPLWNITIKASCLPNVFLSSPEPKVHVKYCHCFVCQASFSELPLSNIFWHFNLFLWNHWIKWMKTWQKCYFGGYQHLIWFSFNLEFQNGCLASFYFFDWLKLKKIYIFSERTCVIQLLHCRNVFHMIL